MKPMVSRIVSIAVAVSAIVCITAVANAQPRPMGLPLTTTLVITKPAPGEIYGNKQVVTMGVNGQIYKFVLNDAYVDDPRGVVHWPDIWQAVSQYRPNFNVTGTGQDTFQKMQPGETLTVRGMFAANNQSFEVMGTQPGGGTFATAQHY